ncbi:hypothetical protein Ahy_A02g007932 [Arachis hypogaea]|uniref:Uncharacterized protein n=1 Tax=Arachis hypogaea TaxID=3818 RepID=A0A445EDG7_ARAHY|nr:hypothetical protein Ahy_A02g007932 [Arachis hypogaea]
MSTHSNPAPEDAAALMMVARTTSYIPKEDPMPSFSLGLTDSSPEEAATQEDCLYHNMAVGNHPNGELLHPKTKKPFRVEDYPMFIPFLDLKKLASRPYGYVISRMRVYAGGAPLKKKDQEIEPPYINISGQKTSYDYAIYVMKWLEIIQPENVKRGKYEWDNWTQDEVDHYRVEYAFRILFHEMNQDKAEATRGDAIRLSKPSSVLLSPYCQIDSNDIDTD